MTLPSRSRVAGIPQGRRQSKSDGALTTEEPEPWLSPTQIDVLLQNGMASSRFIGNLDRIASAEATAPLPYVGSAFSVHLPGPSPLYVIEP